MTNLFNKQLDYFEPTKKENDKVILNFKQKRISPHFFMITDYTFYTSSAPYAFPLSLVLGQSKMAIEIQRHDLQSRNK